MRLGSLILVLWLLVGGFAAYQRGYLGSNEPDVSCAALTTVLTTIVAGPLNYFGVNPRVQCEVPQPSQ